MPVALLILVAFEGVRSGCRQYYKIQAKKYKYDGVFKRDSLGRPLDETTGRKLSRNEARALAEHRRGTANQAEKEKEWKEKGNTLPEYSQISIKDRSHPIATHSTSSESFIVEEDDAEQNWQDWSISGAPCYAEHDEVSHGSSSQLARV